MSTDDDSEAVDVEPKSLRIPIMMSASEVKAIDDWSFTNRVRTRAEAVRRLIQVGLMIRPEMMEEIEKRTVASAASVLDLIDGLRKASDIDNKDDLSATLEELVSLSKAVAGSQLDNASQYMLFTSIIYSAFYAHDINHAYKRTKSDRLKLIEEIAKTAGIELD